MTRSSSWRRKPCSAHSVKPVEDNVYATAVTYRVPFRDTSYLHEALGPPIDQKWLDTSLPQYFPPIPSHMLSQGQSAVHAPAWRVSNVHNNSGSSGATISQVLAIPKAAQS